jgi:hypothetical protein
MQSKGKQLMENQEVRDEVNLILNAYKDLTKRFWYLYEQLDDDTADKITQAGANKWLKYAFTLSMDELWHESVGWDLTEEELPN